jgi:serine/threonine-protein kinase
MSPETIAHYRIVSKLGEGGMGEVYRATDTKLGRDVAIKILPDAFAQDVDRMARFQREAQVLASLNHPNIAAIYGVEERALVMELVDGPTLAERIGQGAIPLEEALPIARQIAEALEYAHERGIIHRDLKPANIKITPEGRVKVLDFGLAKALSAERAVADPASSPTLTMRATMAGVILGTAAYMSPEQARGAAADKRSDIWSYGVVLLEMLTGRQTFAAETVSDTLAAVLRAEVDWTALPPETPAAIRRLLRRCLERDRKKRLPDIAMARLEIDEALAAPAEAPAAPVPQARPAWTFWVAGVAVLVVAAVASIGWWSASRPAPLRPLVRLNAEIAADLPLAKAGLGSALALSPDGQRLAVTLRCADGKVRLYTRLLHQGQVNPLAGTENALSPFFSADSQWIGFQADSKLKKISVDGGAAVTLCDAPAIRGASWGDDGNIVLALGPATTLSRVPSAGGTPVPVTKLANERTHRFPHVLPGSRAVLFTASSTVGNYDDANIEVISLKTGERKTVHRGGFGVRYLPTSAGHGHLVYVHQSTLFAVPFDLGRMVVEGTPVPMLEDINSNPSGGGDFGFSLTGVFVYETGTGRSGGWTISWLDSSGKRQPLQPSPALYYSPSFSPDGKRLAFAMSNGRGSDLWVRDLDRDTPSRLTFLAGDNRGPVWTPDGKGIVFRSENPASPGIYWIRSDGAVEPQRLTDGKLNETGYSFSPDGKRLAFYQNGNGGLDIFTAAFEGDPAHPRLGKPELFLGTPASESRPAFSPDGRWLAYQSDESGNFEVYVRPFPGPGGRWQISTGGGAFPVWSRAGAELLFGTLEGRVMRVNYSASGDSFVAGKPSPWPEASVVSLTGIPTYDLAPDGKRLAAMMPASADTDKPVTHLTFLLNFFDELRRRAPAGGK